MSYHIEITLQGLPKCTNTIRNWRTRMGEAKKWKRMVFEAVVGNRFKPTQPLDRAMLKLTRHSSNSPDFDGLVSSFKHVIDGLIECGVLANDKVSNIGAPEYRWEYAARGKGFITVEVTEISNSAEFPDKRDTTRKTAKEESA